MTPQKTLLEIFENDLDGVPDIPDHRPSPYTLPGNKYLLKDVVWAIVEQHVRCTLDDLIKQKRHKPWVVYKQTYIYCLNRFTDMSIQQIMDEVWINSRNAIYHAIRQIDNQSYPNVTVGETCKAIIRQCEFHLGLQGLEDKLTVTISRADLKILFLGAEIYLPNHQHMNLPMTELWRMYNEQKGKKRAIFGKSIKQDNE